MVVFVKLMFGRAFTTRAGPSMAVSITCKLVSGPKQTSFSPGYCDNSLRSAPLSIIPISNSMTMATPVPAYCCATLRSRVVLMKPHSTAPRTPNSSSSKSALGNTPPAKPLYTAPAGVNLLSLMMAELIACIVLVYMFWQHSVSNLTFRNDGCELAMFAAPPLRTVLYFSNIGPV
ncbi:unnamed protein product [Prorocentrum cordatum]|nr:unnamed protein product [Polarella glacialis]